MKLSMYEDAVPFQLLTSIAVAMMLLIAPSQLLAQSRFDDARNYLDAACRQDAARYDLLRSLKRTVTPEHVAEVYVDAFSTKGADRHAQEVWRRMRAEGGSMEQVIESHLTRYYAKRSVDYRASLKAKITSQIHDMILIHDLVLAFESAKINTKFVAEVKVNNWRKYDRWNALHPVEYYVSMINSKAKGYLSAGFGEEQAALRAAVEAQAAVDRDRRVSRSMIVDKGNVCYKDALKRVEILFRNVATFRAMGALTEAEVAYAIKHLRTKEPNNLSRLSYYTHYKFGPRFYFLDRLRAWRMAAQGSTALKLRR